MMETSTMKWQLRSGPILTGMLVVSLCVSTTPSPAQWQPTGFPNGARLKQVVRATDSTWFCETYDRIYRKDSHDHWSDVGLPTLDRFQGLNAWNDTVVVIDGTGLNRNVRYSFDDGRTWGRHVYKFREIAFIPHTTTYVGWGERAPEGRILELVDFVTGEVQRSQPIHPRAGIGGYLVAADGYVFSKSDIVDSTTKSHGVWHFRVTSSNITDWPFRLDTTLFDARPLMTGGIALFKEHSITVYHGDRTDTLLPPLPIQRPNVSVDLGRDASRWFASVRNENDTLNLLSANGKHWTRLTMPFRASSNNSSIVALTDSGIVCLSNYYGLMHVGFEGGKGVPWSSGLASASGIATNGWMCATARNGGPVDMWLDIDPSSTRKTLSPEVVGIESNWNEPAMGFVEGRLWKHSDSLRVIDYDSETVHAEYLPPGLFSNGVPRQYGDTVFLLNRASVLSRHVQGGEWRSRPIQPPSSPYNEVLALAVSEGGFVVMNWTQEGFYNLTYQVTSHDREGQLTSEPFRVDSIYGDVLSFLYTLTPSLNAIVAERTTGYERLARYATTDGGSTWVEIQGIRPFAAANGLYDVKRVNGVEFLYRSTDLGRSWSVACPSPLPNKRVLDGFCLDRHCYAMTNNGLYMAERAATSVDATSTMQEVFEVRGNVLRVVEAGSITVCDLVGRTLYHREVDPGEIDLSGLPRGLYVVIHQTPSSINSAKILLP
jgi:hypothetical protein